MGGTLVLMGSGELTSTMVEVHKALLRGLGPAPRAVFLDTPAGFQLNADELSARAATYFRERVGAELEVASLKSAALPELEAAPGCQRLREADYVLVGPGSPSYAVRQWQRGPVPGLLAELLGRGGCLVAASAAALTVGKFTLPVYEIYKVGEDLHWLEGIDLLGRFGLEFAVIPHWNNAEGGTHDTRRCYMGEPRFRELARRLPSTTGVLGLDEHTACLLDLGRGEVSVRGLGGVTLRRGGAEVVLERGRTYPLSVLTGGEALPVPAGTAAAAAGWEGAPVLAAEALWDRLRAEEARFGAGLDGGDPAAATAALLEVDRLLWSAHEGREDPEAVTQGRELLRDLVVQLGMHLAGLPPSAEACLSPLVEALLAHRAALRQGGEYVAADGIRDCLLAAGVVVEDRAEGVRWYLG
ncbi:MAG: hypothetical protein P1P84_23100 [Deferrisomatales bacterium]|nr:hypothetical protein [Deferrisomatales bacterium]